MATQKMQPTPVAEVKSLHTVLHDIFFFLVSNTVVAEVLNYRDYFWSLLLRLQYSEPRSRSKYPHKSSHVTIVEVRGCKFFVLTMKSFSFLNVLWVIGVHNAITATGSLRSGEMMLIVPDASSQPSPMDQIWSSFWNISLDPAKLIPSTQSKMVKVPPASQRLLEFGTLMTKTSACSGTALVGVLIHEP